jgi:hypothetical protein
VLFGGQLPMRKRSENAESLFSDNVCYFFLHKKCPFQYQKGHIKKKIKNIFKNSV